MDHSSRLATGFAGNESRIALLAIALAFGAGATAFAEEAPSDDGEKFVLPTVEVVGEEERLPEIAGSVFVLEKEELQQSRVFNVNEALRKAPGVNIRDEDGFALRPNIGIRGLNPTRSTKVLLLEDGIPLAYAPYGDNASYYHPPIERYDRIEILKGSEQILFGPQTLGGVINYRTPAPPQELGGSVRLTGGTREYFNGHLRAGGKGILLDALRKQGDGSRDNEELEQLDLNLKGAFDIAENHAIVFRGNYYNEDSDVSYTGITEAERRNFGLRYNPFENDEMEIDRYGGSATHEWAAMERVTVTTSAYGSFFSRDWWRQSSTTTDSQCGADFVEARVAGERVDPNACASIQGRLRDYYTYGVEPRVDVAYEVAGIGNELKFGFRAHFEEQQRLQENGTSPNARSGPRSEDQERTTDAYSGFVQNRVLIDDFTFTPGVRVEHVRNERVNELTGGSGDTDLTEAIPGVGMTYVPVEGTTLFFGVHRGFAPPRTEDLILTASDAPTATFTEVDEEESWNYEVGARSDPVSWAHVEATYFRNDFDNLIAVGSIGGGSVPLAEGEALFQGFEFLGRVDGRDFLGGDHNPYVQTVYTYLATAEQDTPFRQVSDGAPIAGSAAGNRQPYAPEHLVTANVGWEHVSGIDLSFEVVHVSEQFGDFAETRAPSPDGLKGIIDDYTILNLATNYVYEPLGTTVFLTVKNLADEDYFADRTRGIRAGLPRLVQGGVELLF